MKNKNVVINVETKGDVNSVWTSSTQLSEQTETENKASLCKPEKYEDTLNRRVYYNLLIILIVDNIDMA